MVTPLLLQTFQANRPCLPIPCQQLRLIPRAGRLCAGADMEKANFLCGPDGIFKKRANAVPPEGWFPAAKIQFTEAAIPTRFAYF